jgi:hypothetical protein
MFVVGQYGILKYAEHDNEKVTNSGHGFSAFQQLIRATVITCQHIVIAIFIFVLFQIVFAHERFIHDLKLIVFMSYGISYSLRGLPAIRFFSWFSLVIIHLLLLFFLETAFIKCCPRHCLCKQ